MNAPSILPRLRGRCRAQRDGGGTRAYPPSASPHFVCSAPPSGFAFGYAAANETPWARRSWKRRRPQAGEERLVARWADLLRASAAPRESLYAVAVPNRRPLTWLDG